MTILWVNVYESGTLDFLIYPPYGGETNDTTGYFAQPYAGDGFVYHAGGRAVGFPPMHYTAMFR